MKTTTKTIIVILAIVGFFTVLQRAITLTDKSRCHYYISQSEEIQGWFISQADYEMCQFYGMDFSEFVK